MRRSLLLGPKIVPAEPVEIDWMHPLAKGLVFLWVAPAFRNLVDGAYPAAGIGPHPAYQDITIVTSPLGQSVSYTSTAGGIWMADGYMPVTTSNGVGTGDYTIATYGNLPAGLSGQYIAVAQSSGPNQTRLFVGTDYTLSSVTGAVGLMNYDSGSFYGANTAPGAADGDYHTWVGVRNSGVYAIWRDGVDETVSSAPGAPNVLGGADGIALGNYPRSGTNCPVFTQPWAMACSILCRSVGDAASK